MNIDLNISVTIIATAKLQTPLEAQKPQLSAEKILLEIRQLTAEKMRKTLKKLPKKCQNLQKCEKMCKTTNVCTAVADKPFELEKIRKQFWMRMDLKIQKK